MIRFAVTITAIEVALTVFASLWITFAESGEPYITPEEFAQLGIEVENCTSEHRTRFGSPFSYDTQAVVKGGGPSIYVSLRIQTPKAEYDGRLAGEQFPKPKEGDEVPSVTNEPWRKELGYGARQRGRNGFRSEVVRFRGSDMLVLRVIWMTRPESNPGFQAARCERLVRQLQDHMLLKLGWREGDLR